MLHARAGAETTVRRLFVRSFVRSFVRLFVRLSVRMELLQRFLFKPMYLTKQT